MGKELTDEQKANRKKGGMTVQGEQLEKYRRRAIQQRLERERNQVNEN
jgi:hypothetical protein